MLDQGSRILVTGGTDGIGKGLVVALYERGFRPVAHGRNKDRLAAVQREMPLLETLKADFSRMRDVVAMGQELRAHGEHFDGLILNAGVFMQERVLTEDGHETTFQVNHLAHLRLLLDLVPALRPGARITVVASTSHEKVKSVDLDNLDWHRGYEGYPAYGLAKLAQVGTVMELAPGLSERGISICALHPGSILTKLQVAGWGGGGNPDSAGAVERVLDMALGLERPSGTWWVDGASRDPNSLLLDPVLRRALHEKSMAMAGVACER